ncbi:MULTISPECIES: Uma2 family endonuclease [Cyanophyceae]|uniref:Uma2 family endonuclease n=1 Tax=Cyanophyceae TaxID=3028117 RepID=UPI001687662F|nr:MULTISPECIES: Uma2 family endonuclease [Cyanophyceae]MBD1918786.1 Uma2 family endonuclease [Phormidium sp. FACHB-77]MBD2033371.1 Uma2 family endonuclease [Phormidium sp. FACHB-322]MBD2053696.1 Uma2 family endonuclease [Leptolyngbya sp. FACHB-60]
MTTLDLPLELNLEAVHFTDEQFYQLCIHNPEVAIEQNAQGVLIVMPPVGGESGNREMEVGGELYLWNKQTQLGKVFSSSTIFQLLIGSKRSPDAAWVELSRWEALTPEQRRRFPPIAPDFVMELRSSTDNLTTLREKMQEYVASGVRLGWLINPQDQQVEIYRPGQEAEVRSLPTQLSGESVLPGFTLAVSPFS